MNFATFYDQIVIAALEAKAAFQGKADLSFEKLDLLQTNIKILTDIRHNLFNIDDLNCKKRKRLHPDKSVPKKGQEAIISEAITFQDTASDYERNTNDITSYYKSDYLQEAQVCDIEYNLNAYTDSTNLNNNISTFSTKNTNNNLILSPEIVERLDQVFFGFLARVCGDLNAVDYSGEKLHATLIAKRLNKGSDTTLFYSFKFRIRAFCNAFREELARSGLTDDAISDKQFKLYLWTQRYISRFNVSGNSNKSNGTCVWIVEAKKTFDGGWIFKEFERKFLGEDTFNLHVGVPFTLKPKIYDPQVQSPRPIFHSVALPSWLRWEEDYLTGVPDLYSTDCTIKIYASYQYCECNFRIEKTLTLNILHGQNSQKNFQNQDEQEEESDDNFKE
ncbi:hypothetical protein HK099_005785 [Clydaea vesicula]|uniref:Uncharacterized protein n=1 Tax=Clydaea vesicula TaxID=447962 RepID=A0AAD5TYN7_9FUNG|nr:hypothetical protein HK099_005785 [Clydaea vesicula]